jgi:hypothetical protein
VSRVRTHLAVVLVTCVGVAGCGSSEEQQGEKLPAASVSELSKRLEEVERRYRVGVEDGKQGACDDIENDSFPAIERLLADLPQDVDPDLRDAVERSFTRLRELIRGECADVKPPETETETTPEPEPVPIPQETAPPEPPPEEQVPTVEEKPKKDKGGGQGNDNGSGQGNGQGNDQAPSEEGGSVAPELEG